MEARIAVIGIGMLLDFLIGDPQNPWHPICLIGNMIAGYEKKIRKRFPKTPSGERWGGIFLVGLVLATVGVITAGMLWACYGISKPLGILMEGILCYFMLAACSLKTESMKVYHAFVKNDLEQARFAVSMIVGRDTKVLTAEGIQKAAVETVAENTSDGEIAPLFYMMLLGGFGGVLYKAVNTMDSMLGYKNETYLHFGWAAAKLDDICNWIPSRLAAICMIGAAWILEVAERCKRSSMKSLEDTENKGTKNRDTKNRDTKNGGWFSGKHAYRIWKRDRRNHKSPNSAQTEAVCAGALQIQLAGPAWYFGEYYDKPTIGDAMRKIEYEDIKRANQLLYGTSLLFWVAVSIVLWIFK